MISQNFQTVAYVVAAADVHPEPLGLSNPETAPRGNLFGIVGMVLALLGTALGETFDSVGAWVLLLAAVAPACVIGVVVAKRVKITEMPRTGGAAPQLRGGGGGAGRVQHLPAPGRGARVMSSPTPRS